MHRYPFIVDIPADEYHEAARRGEFLSSHLLGDFREPTGSDKIATVDCHSRFSLS